MRKDAFVQYTGHKSSSATEASNDNKMYFRSFFFFFLFIYDNETIDVLLRVVSPKIEHCLPIAVKATTPAIVTGIVVVVREFSKFLFHSIEVQSSLIGCQSTYKVDVDMSLCMPCFESAFVQLVTS